MVHDFCRLYWNQTGPDVYGTLDRALRQMLADVEKLSDGGEAFKRSLAEEFIQLDASFEQLATEAPHGRCLNLEYAFLFKGDVQSLKEIVLSEMSSKDS